MPKTIRQVRIESAARTITAHLMRPAGNCSCGDSWSPLHVARALAEAGDLGPEPGVGR